MADRKDITARTGAPNAAARHQRPRPKLTPALAAAVSAVRAADKLQRKLGKASDAAEQAQLDLERDPNRKYAPYPPELTFHGPAMTFSLNGETREFPAFKHTYKDADSIRRSDWLEPETKEVMLRALAEHEAAQAALDEAAGITAAIRATKEADAAFVAAYGQLLALVDAACRIPTRERADVDAKLALIENCDGADEVEEAQFLRAALEAALAAPSPAIGGATPAWRAYLVAKHHTDYGANIQDEEVDALVAMEEAATATPVGSIDDALTVLCAGWTGVRGWLEGGDIRDPREFLDGQECTAIEGALAWLTEHA
jgi:hypothetical protein